MSDDEEAGDELLTSEVMNKYTTAATIANNALAKVVSELKAGATLFSLCETGDKFINEEVKKVLKSHKIDRGVAFPTCISRNNVVGHFSAEAEDKDVLENEDLVKIDLGVHLDGYIATAAHTHIVGQTGQATSGKKADVICAAHVAGEAVLRALKPGATNKDITAIIKQVADVYKVNPVEGVLSHKMSRFIIDGQKIIMNKTTADQQTEEYEIEEHDVFGIDIVMSTGDGKPKEKDRKATIYKRVVDQSYMLKMQASRKVYTEINKKFPALPFSIRFMEEKHVRFGLSELEKHGLINAFPVLYEKNGEFVAQFKYTALIGNRGAKRITEHPLPYVSSEFAVEDEALKALLASTPVFAGGKGGKKKKAKKEAKKAAEGSGTSTTTTTTTTATTATTASTATTATTAIV